MNDSMTWLLWSGSYDEALSLARGVALGPDSDVTLALSDGKLFNLYKYYPSQSKVFAHSSGFWNRSGVYMEYFNRNSIRFDGTRVNVTTLVSMVK